ncbi:MAG: VWA domain-containing protein [Eubacteriales bacterium]|nr:VWA domain-containing protein [Eubacteriales bacterium]
MKRPIFPFSAVLGQEQIKNALIWNFINPQIGGVLISGQKGTAKSTLVRASGAISGKKIIELPLNATEDRLVGAIDFEEAIRRGVRKLEKGILYEADQNVLYVDEINLLSDNLTKILVEAAGDGVCRVEREGISASYPCRFVLVGSMNPEESGLRSQLLDRFGLYVDVTAEENPLLRCEIVRRRIAFEADSQAFAEEYQEEERQLAGRIQKAKERLSSIGVSDAALTLAAQLAQNANCQGSRGEIAVIETARAICAWNGSSSVNKEAITEAARYALPHRMRDAQPAPQQTETPPEEDQREEAPEEPTEETRETEPPSEPEKTPEEQQTKESEEDPKPEESGSDSGQSAPGKEKEKTEEIGETFAVGRWLEEKSKTLVRRGSGRRSLVKTSSLQGRYVKSTMNRREDLDLAFDATLRAAAPYQKTRRREDLALVIEKEDIRTKVREKRTGNFIVFVVDASGSMGVGRRMAAVKGAILSMLGDAYQKRDKVAMITFRRNQAELVLGMTRSVDLAAKKLETLSTGGKTPLYAGLEAAHTLVQAARRREKDLLPVVVLVSDGRATAGRSKNPFADAVEEGKALTADHIKTVIIDVEQDFIKLRLAEKLGREMDATVYQLSELRAGAIVSAVSMAVKENTGILRKKRRADE